MNDMSSVIVPKSDQINADDLIGTGPITITIQEVRISPGSEQPVSILFGSPDGKVWRPCKSMSRVLVAMWGPDAKQYVGRSLTLYRDPTVKWGGLEVGGIRISHMSHIGEQKTMALTMTRANRKPYTVRPLADAPAPNDKAAKWTADYLAKLATLTGDDATTFRDQHAPKVEQLRAKRPELASQIDLALSNAIAPDDGFDFEEGKPDDAHGDQRDGVLDQALAAIEKATTREMVDAIVNEAADRLTDQEHETLRSAAVDRIADLQPTVVE